MYFSVGYPLGWVKTSDTPLEYREKIEVKGKFVLLDSFLSMVWSGLSASKSDNSAIQEIDELLASTGYIPNNDRATPSILQMLVEKGVVMYAKSSTELFEYIKDFKITRYGIPHYDEEMMINFQELRTLMFSGSTPTPISELQLDIWRSADGTKTLEEIYNGNFLNVSLSNFIDDICYLRDETLLLFYIC